MFVTYTPDDGEPRSWQFDPADEWSKDMILVEKLYGGTWAEFVAGVLGRDTSARRVLLWHLMRREHPMLSFRDLPEFKGRHITVEQSVAELEKGRAAWEAAGGPAEADGEMVAAMFADEIDAARAKFGDGEGKVPSNNVLRPTSG